MGKKIKSLKKRKKNFFEDLTLLVVPKGKIQLLQRNLTLFKPINILFNWFVRKKIIQFVARHSASRGRKSKAGGGKKSKATQEYTPLELLPNSNKLAQTLSNIHYN